jgi:hypothetical protein
METEQDKLRRRIQELSDNLNAMQKNVQDVGFSINLCFEIISNLNPISGGLVCQRSHVLWL